ncbi:MAG: hypothetical protein JXA08_10600 [Methanomicrobiaceae archaeon]|nr:hypothetical protein [Methanomicrobiaceae archaeon]
MKSRPLPLLIVFLCLLIILQPLAVSAFAAGEAKQAWHAAKSRSTDMQEAHRQAKVDWAADQTPENNRLVIDTGKEALSAALDEAEAWLVWKQLEAEENPDIPDDLKNQVSDDVEENLAKIGELREDVDAIETRLDLGLTYLKMVGRYLELLTDVARDSGLVWVHVAGTYADTIEAYEADLREAAVTMPDNGAILSKLDLADAELAAARKNIADAREEYLSVKAGGTPLISFSNGNNSLKIARGNMLSAQGYLSHAYGLIVAGGVYEKIHPLYRHSRLRPAGRRVRKTPAGSGWGG